MIETFETVFDRRPFTKELILLRKLRKLYGEELVKEAIRLSISVQEGSPIRYIIAVANNLYKEFVSLKEQTSKRLEEMKKYGYN
jgi:hypothetical protein